MLSLFQVSLLPSGGSGSGSKKVPISRSVISDSDDEDEGSRKKKKRQGKKAVSKVDEKAMAYAKAVMEAKSTAMLGWARMVLFPNTDNAKLQPELLRQAINPRDATVDEVTVFLEQCMTKIGCLDQGNWKFALVLLVDPDLIANLDEIKMWAPGSTGPLSDIRWTIIAGGRTMTLGNGNHRWWAVQRLLEDKFKQLSLMRMWLLDYKSRDVHSEVDNANKTKNDEGIQEVMAIIEKESTFCVELYDEREHF